MNELRWRTQLAEKKNVCFKLDNWIISLKNKNETTKRRAKKEKSDYCVHRLHASTSNEWREKKKRVSNRFAGWRPFFVFSFYIYIFSLWLVTTTICRESVYWMGPFNEILIKMRRLFRWLKRMSTIRRHVDVFCIYANFSSFVQTSSAQLFNFRWRSIVFKWLNTCTCTLRHANYKLCEATAFSSVDRQHNRMESGPFSIVMNHLYTNQLE